VTPTTEHLRLAAAARSVIDEVRVSAAEPAVMAEAAALLERAAGLLAPHGFRGKHAQSTLDGSSMTGAQLAGAPTEFFPYSPVIGPLNPVAPPAEFVPVGEPGSATMTGSVVFPPVLVGPPGLAHGGAIALLLDELLGVLKVVNGMGAMTGTLTIRYRSPTPAGTLLGLHAEIRGVEGRKIFSHGEIRHGDVVTAEADGVFIRVAGMPAATGGSGNPGNPGSPGSPGSPEPGSTGPG
jgi:acyl-coenzyme A thioesterase PaaI-like protein